MRAALVSLMLLSGAVQDMRTKTIRADLLLAPGLLAVLLNLAEKGTGAVTGMLMGLLPGILLFLLSLASRQAVGRGDALTVSLLGAALGLPEVFCILMLALLGSAFFSCLLLIMHRAAKHTALPFIPFLAAAYLIRLIFL